MNNDAPIDPSLPDPAAPQASPPRPPAQRRRDWARWWSAGLRAATLRPLGPLPLTVGPWVLPLVLAVASAATVTTQWLGYAGELSFSPLGWVWGWIHLLFPLALVWWAFAFTRRHAAHTQPVAAWVLLSQLTLVLPSLAMGAWGSLLQQDQLPAALRTSTAAWTAYGLCLLWTLLSLWRITQSLHRWRPMHALLPLGVTGLLFLQSIWLNTSAWAAVATDPSERPVLELRQEVFFRQEALLQEAIDAVVDRPADGARVFGLVYAPYAQDVFLRESAMVTEQIEKRLGGEGRVIRLMNHAGSTDSLPWATPHNLRRSIEALGTRMDRERDVLVIYLTSHGGRDHRLASSHWPLTVDDLGAAELRRWLDEAGIRFRAVAVSACYSGGWIDPLKNENTLVMTAADKDHTSYGCGSDSDLTFFGKAVFQEQLAHTDSLEAAFTAAVPLIRSREEQAGKDDGFSNPQISVGEGFRSQWQRRERSRGAT